MSMNETGNKGIIYKVGDVVYQHNTFRGWSKLTVDRVTPTMAILSNEVKLKQGKFAGGSAIGASGFDRDSYFPDTQETRKMAARDQNKTYAIHHKLAKFTERTGPSDDVIAKIVAIHKAAMAQINEILNEK